MNAPPLPARQVRSRRRTTPRRSSSVYDEPGGAMVVAQRIPFAYHQGAVVGPHFGIADLGAHFRQLVERLGARLGRHPLERSDRLLVGGHDVGCDLLDPFLVPLREMARNVQLADRFAHGAIERRDALLPARFGHRGASQRGAAEGEARLAENAWQHIGVGVEHAQLEVQLPVGQRQLGEQARGIGQRAGLGDGDAGRRIQACAPEEQVPAHLRRVLRQCGRGHRVVDAGHVVGILAFPVALGQTLFERQHAACGIAWLRHAGQPGQRFKVSAVGSGSLGKALILGRQVVGTIGKAKTALPCDGAVDGGVFQIGEDAQPHRRLDHALHPALPCHQRVNGRHRIQVVQQRAHWRQACPVDGGRVQVARVKGADLLFDRRGAFRCSGQAVDDGPDAGVGNVIDLHADDIRFAGRDRRAVEPGPIGRPEQVVLYADLRIAAGGIDATAGQIGGSCAAGEQEGENRMRDCFHDGFRSVR